MDAFHRKSVASQRGWAAVSEKKIESSFFSHTAASAAAGLAAAAAAGASLCVYFWRQQPGRDPGTSRRAWQRPAIHAFHHLNCTWTAALRSTDPMWWGWGRLAGGKWRHWESWWSGRAAFECRAAAEFHPNEWPPLGFVVQAPRRPAQWRWLAVHPLVPCPLPVWLLPNAGSSVEAR